jgi:hypothetical protein
MRTVESLIRELQTFPSDAVCWAYEGEVSGIVIAEPAGYPRKEIGVIHCGEGDIDEPPTEHRQIGG